MICSRISWIFSGEVDVTAACVWEGEGEGRIERGQLEAGLYAHLGQEWGCGVAQGKELELRHFGEARTVWPAASEQE